MTIKHLGGIFGRNPTFNEVTVDGNLNARDNIIMADGKGIDFSATAGAGTSEIFNYYEEGTFTATLTPSTSGTITVNGALNECSYVKYGKLVTITGQISVTSVSSPVGYISINLPFASDNATESSAVSTGSIIVRLSLGQNAGDFGIVVFESSATARIYLLDGNEWQSDSAQAMKQYTNINICLTYRTA